MPLKNTAKEFNCSADYVLISKHSLTVPAAVCPPGAFTAKGPSAGPTHLVEAGEEHKQDLPHAVLHSVLLGVHVASRPGRGHQCLLGAGSTRGHSLSLWLTETSTTASNSAPGPPTGRQDEKEDTPLVSFHNDAFLT